MSLWERIRQIWMDFLLRMAKTNRETYGSGRLDCCAPKAQGKGRSTTK